MDRWKELVRLLHLTIHTILLLSLFDVEKGYNTCGYLGRITRTSDEMTEEEYNQEIETAIDEIIKYDFKNIYRKVYRDVKPAMAM